MDDPGFWDDDIPITDDTPAGRQKEEPEVFERPLTEADIIAGRGRHSRVPGPVKVPDGSFEELMLKYGYKRGT